MKRYPGTFSDAMIRAILDGRKTQDRRVVGGYDGIWSIPADDNGVFWPGGEDEMGDWQWFPSPFGQPGDKFWVPECWKDCLSKFHDTGNPDDHGGPHDPCWGYRATMTYRCGKPIPDGMSYQRWKPPWCMPQRAARITVEIVSIRVERLQDISDEDVVDEGVDIGKQPYPPTMPECREFDCDFEVAFRELWDSRNTKLGHGWDANPWVWVPEFKHV